MNHKVCCYFLGLLLILSIFWCSTGVAVTSLPIYSVQVPVQSMSETERNKALPLQHTIQLDKKLQPIQDQELGGQDSSVLKFRYQEGLS